ncbi:Yos1-like protein [Irpex rosettiformis]|uniref:Yos1-like protein n=1 Tax=Irpex rosettiformis TaxID=378272 RepID=A0ACB8UCV0_9APHY|nr:Yos1-like protein [Irpex rosettiformis]
MLSLGSILYVSLLLINAMAVLSEDRFLAKIGWASTHVQAGQTQAGYAQGYGQPYDQQGGQDIGMKGRLINLISAVRTLMRIPLIALNLVIIGYELILGG